MRHRGGVGKLPSIFRCMDTFTSYPVHPVGIVRSSIRRRADAPRRGSTCRIVAVIEIEAPFLPALEGITAGQEILVLTWLHQTNRDTLQVHRRKDPTTPLTGVFSTRSPDRPNPIGLHRLTVL